MIAEDKYNVVEKEDGYVGSNPTIFTNLNEYRLLGDKVSINGF